MKNSEKIFRKVKWSSSLVWAGCLLGALGLFLFPLFSIPGESLAARESVSLEHKLKAAFTFNFIKFIDWPKEDSNGKFTLYLLGAGPINDALSDLDGKEISGRTLTVQEIDGVEEGNQPGILFVNVSKKRSLSNILEKAREKGMLTIGEMDGFCDQGGIINFVIRDDSINFEINLKEAKRSRLSISYKLLNQAIKIYK
ncbi:MAG: YfiR family protein [Candidatus Nitronauta litoralis]|uniref:YfiR family protein n=1 Tax=Candidatus Nitronauta litoralis TaxID=2705533 RepID=A0A7T0FZF1_9BACT|nr:MAG: YfiR family protein [Candidatus Nitronauta litoralis]